MEVLRMDKVSHFELPVDDLERAKSFYRSAFEWDLNDMDMGGGATYTIVTTAPLDDEGRLPRDPGAINGGLFQRNADTSTPVITIEVADIDASIGKIEAGGGSVVKPRTEIPGMGAYAYFKDSEGNVVGLWETSRG
jgi:predicted enzyme related to lactoylglutathione lyase